MTDKKISQLTARNIVAATDQIVTLAEGTDYRSPVASLVNLIGGGGSSSSGINGIALLRGLQVVNDQVVYLNFHTTAGDYGAGQFRGATTGGPYLDNDGTIVVPTGGDGTTAWLRVWDKIKAHVGWFGAKCQPETAAGPDDYAAVQKCLYLFTSGRTSGGAYGGGTIDTGIIDVGPGFNFSQPLVYGGVGHNSFKWVGTHSLGRGGQEPSLLRYTGPETYASVIFYGANEYFVEDINFLPGLAKCGLFITADNSYNNAPAGVHTTSHAITAGNNVVVTPAFAGAGTGNAATDRVQYLQPGVMLGVGGKSIAGGAAAGADFEIVYITAVDTVAGTFTADFKKDHDSGSLLGGSSPCSNGFISRCCFVTPTSPVWGKLSANSTNLGLDSTGRYVYRFEITDITGIKVGHPLRVGSFLYAEIVYPLTVTAGTGVTGTVDAYASFGHFTDDIVMFPTSGIAFGNRLTSTVQVDNVVISSCRWTVADTQKSYAGFRQIWGGNVKAFQFNNSFASYMRVAFAFEYSSGQYIFNGGTTSGLTESIWHNLGATATISGWEDESSALWLTGLGGSNASQATFIGCSFQGGAPIQLPAVGGIVGATDEMIVFGGNLTLIGCRLTNNRVYATTLPHITISGATSVGPYPGTLGLINCTIVNATLANFQNLVWRAPGDGSVSVLKDGTGPILMLNCIGWTVGTPVRLPNIIPPLNMWQGSMVYDPPSMAAGTVAPVTTLVPTETPDPIIGAKLGDLVEASFSNDLQGATLRAWVSATNTVKFQFAYPLGSTPTPLDLASGTVKCRVKK